MKPKSEYAKMGISSKLHLRRFITKVGKAMQGKTFLKCLVTLKVPNTRTAVEKQNRELLHKSPRARTSLPEDLCPKTIISLGTVIVDIHPRL